MPLAAGLAAIPALDTCWGAARRALHAYPGRKPSHALTLAVVERLN